VYFNHFVNYKIYRILPDIVLAVQLPMLAPSFVALTFWLLEGKLYFKQYEEEANMCQLLR